MHRMRRFHRSPIALFCPSDSHLQKLLNVYLVIVPTMHGCLVALGYRPDSHLGTMHGCFSTQALLLTLFAKHISDFRLFTD